MSRGPWVWREGLGLVSKDEAPPLHNPKPSHLACPMIMGDSMAPVVSPADGKVYDSKSAIRAGYKARGLIEVGNDGARLRNDAKPKPDRRVIKDTIEKATARFNRGERVSSR